MRQRNERALTVVAVAGTTVVVAAFACLLLRQRSLEVMYGLFLAHNGPSAVVLLWMSRLVLLRRPGNVAGRALLAIGVVHTLHVAVASWADLSLVAAGYPQPLTELAFLVVPADLPLEAAVPLWIMGWLWVPAPVLAATLLVLVFPDGHLSGTRWRPVLTTALIGSAVFMVGVGIDGWPTATWAVDEAPIVVPILLACGGLLIAVSAAVSIIGLLLRWRRTEPSRRQPFHVVGWAVIAFTLIALVTYPWQTIWVPAVLVAFNVVIVAYALAVTRYRLHDLEPVLGRAAVATVVSALIGAVYLTIVVGAAGLLGNRVDSRLLPLVAVAAVALLVEPARRRTRRFVDRVLFGRRADRVEVMSRLAAHASTASAAEVLDEVTRLLVRSTGATRAAVCLDGEPASSGIPVLRAPVEYQGQRFGEIHLYAKTSADLAGDAPQLIADVTHTLGVVLHNDRLTAQLRDRLDELQASQRRLVEAHHEARRGLERDIHDGAQARLIAVKMRVGALRVKAERHATAAQLTTDLDELGCEVDRAVRSLRTLARGLNPPILEQSGVAEALRAHTRELPLPVRILAGGAARYPRTVEAAVYFSCLEAIQNAVRHANAAGVTVELTGENDRIRFEVRDDGAGFDPTRSVAGSGLANIADRMSALGGQASVHATPGGGTRVTGWAPAQPFTADR